MEMTRQLLFAMISALMTPSSMKILSPAPSSYNWRHQRFGVGAECADCGCVALDRLEVALVSCQKFDKLLDIFVPRWPTFTRTSSCDIFRVDTP
jgi:bacterioferritin-associated ferredoxin